MLDPARLTELLRQFLDDPPPELIAQLHTYLDLLLRWNARTNLTAVRAPEQIVTRHFGESLFAARVLRDAGALGGEVSLADVGSGAGFPGIPIKLFAPEVQLTLIESQNKKATFLREAVRALHLTTVTVFGGRAENLARQFNVVTLRAVEKFESALPVAASLAAPNGSLCLLLGEGQHEAATARLSSAWNMTNRHKIPESGNRIISLARRIGTITD